MQKYVDPNLPMDSTIIEGDLVRILGRTIRQYRLALGFTPWEFAEDIGCTPGFLLKLEEGEVDPELRVLERCASALKMTISELL